MIVVGVVQFVLDQGRSRSNWLDFHLHDVLHCDAHVVPINLNFRPILARVRSIPLLGLVIAAVVAT